MINVVTKGFRARYRKVSNPSRRNARSARKIRNGVIRKDRRAARTALHVGDFEAPRTPLARLTGRRL